MPASPLAQVAGEGPSTNAAVASAAFRAIGTTCQILATDHDALQSAVEITRDELAALDLAISRFRPDSEVSRLAAAATDGPADAIASPLFANHLRAARKAARLTGGLVDFTIGQVLALRGYDADLDTVQARPHSGTTRATSTNTVPGWQTVTIDAVDDRVHSPQGVVIDLGSTGKAHAADLISATLATQLRGGFLVNLGGDIATAGDEPPGGWRVGVEDEHGAIHDVIALACDQAMASSSTRLRTWATDTGVAHHILNPRTGAIAPTTWAMVTVVAATALEANAASTAAVVLGEEAVGWLTGHRLPARLQRPNGTAITTPGWPDPLTGASA
ncbi:MAG: FAD:protein FMN transferase [Phycicoccus sp.]|nr:FAD:protein FMN transferase [Phycicoccus sp.]